MNRRRNTRQADLFDAPRTLELKERVRALDRQIAAALKKDDYDKARELTKEQEGLIQELVKLGEEQQTDAEEKTANAK